MIAVVFANCMLRQLTLLTLLVPFPSAVLWRASNSPNPTDVGHTLPDVRNPGFFTLDFLLTKNTKSKERLALQFCAEAFNLDNYLRSCRLQPAVRDEVDLDTQSTRSHDSTC
jgi:hypothetical protein